MDAVVVTAAMINNLQAIVSREISPADPAVVTVGSIRRHTLERGGGEQLYDRHYPRFSNEVWRHLPRTDMERIVKSTAETYRAEAELEYLRIVPPTVNDRRWSPWPRSPPRPFWARTVWQTCLPPPAARTSLTSCRRCPALLPCWAPAARPAVPLGPTIPATSAWDEAQLVKGAMLYAQVAMDFNAQ